MYIQGIQSHLGSMLIGPAGSGKVQLIKVYSILYFHLDVLIKLMNYK